MGRALMTPDELRRMDNELCIIFEKGLKPIKANKFYYFRNQNMNRRLNQNRLDHNNFDSGVRGEWRKFNPQNPYTDATDKPEQDLKVESLDDLFEDDVKPITPPTPQAQPKAVENVKNKKKHQCFQWKIILEKTNCFRKIYKKNWKQNLMNYLAQ